MSRNLLQPLTSKQKTLFEEMRITKKSVPELFNMNLRREKRQERERGREKGEEERERERFHLSPPQAPLGLGFASEASAILGVSNELFGFSRERLKHWLHPCGGIIR